MFRLESAPKPPQIYHGISVLPPNLYILGEPEPESAEKCNEMAAFLALCMISFFALIPTIFAQVFVARE